MIEDYDGFLLGFTSASEKKFHVFDKIMKKNALKVKRY